ISSDGHMRLVISVHLTDTPEGHMIIAESETEAEEIANVSVAPATESAALEENAVVLVSPTSTPEPKPSPTVRPSPSPQPKATWQQGKLVFLQGTTLYTMDLGNEGTPQELASIESNAIVLGPLWSPDGR